jgi:hypothetical protein
MRFLELMMNPEDEDSFYRSLDILKPLIYILLLTYVSSIYNNNNFWRLIMTKHYDDFGINKVTMTSEEFLRNTSAYQCNYGDGTKNYYEVDGEVVEVKITA